MAKLGDMSLPGAEEMGAFDAVQAQVLPRESCERENSVLEAA
jgi:hypothetical protein